MIEPSFRRISKKFLDDTTTQASDEFGSICWNVIVTESSYPGTKSKTKKADLAAQVRITDCYKIATIDLSANTLEEFDERILKARSLFDSVREMLTALEMSREVFARILEEPNPKYDGNSSTDDE